MSQAIRALAQAASQGVSGAANASGLAPRRRPARPRPAPIKPVVGEALRRVEWKRAVLKTVTFRVIVATLDFGTNLFVLGNPAVAAGLTTFSTVAGPFFYFVHEAGWNYFGTREGEAERPPVRIVGVTISRALGKTITYRTLATISEFSATYVIVGDLATAALLSSFGFVLGPFVYYAHERVWERFGGAAPKPAALRIVYAGA